MSIKKIKSNNNDKNINLVQIQFDNILLDKSLQNLPKDIKDKLQQKITEFKKELSQYSLEKTIEYRNICGEMAEETKILEIIIQASDNSKWKLQETNKVNEHDIQDIKNQFGVSFVENNVMQYIYSCSTRSRNDVSMVIVTALPGYNYIAINTHDVGVYVEELLTNKEMGGVLGSYY